MQNIVIIGATSGIAKAFSYQCASQNKCNLLLCGRDMDELNLIASDISIKYSIAVKTQYFDAFDLETIESFFQNCLKELGSIDLVFTAYGRMDSQEQGQFYLKNIKATMDVNFTSTVLLLETAASYLEKRKSGAICAISSVAGDRGRQSNYIYGSSKGGLTIYLQGLRNRLQPFHVHVLTVKPGFVDTAMTYGKSGMFLVASTESVAASIYKAIQKRKNQIYTPWFWKWIMFIIRSIPENIFKKLKL